MKVSKDFERRLQSFYGGVNDKTYTWAKKVITDWVGAVDASVNTTREKELIEPTIVATKEGGLKFVWMDDHYHVEYEMLDTGDGGTEFPVVTAFKDGKQLFQGQTNVHYMGQLIRYQLTEILDDMTLRVGAKQLLTNFSEIEAVLDQETDPDAKFETKVEPT